VLFLVGGLRHGRKVAIRAHVSQREAAVAAPVCKARLLRSVVSTIHAFVSLGFWATEGHFRQGRSCYFTPVARLVSIVKRVLAAVVATFAHAMPRTARAAAVGVVVAKSAALWARQRE